MTQPPSGPAFKPTFERLEAGQGPIGQSAGRVDDPQPIRFTEDDYRINCSGRAAGEPRSGATITVDGVTRTAHLSVDPPRLGESLRFDDLAFFTAPLRPVGPTAADAVRELQGPNSVAQIVKAMADEHAKLHAILEAQADQAKRISAVVANTRRILEAMGLPLGEDDPS